RERAWLLPVQEYLIEQIGRMAAALAVASLRNCYPNLASPVLHENGPIRFQAKNMYHPLIESPVPCSVDAKTSLLVTGSNASGKSTFLKTAALEALLAQTIHTVTADSYEARYFRIYSSMALRDDLVGEESYYMVEIRSLKRILDRVDGEIQEESTAGPQKRDRSGKGPNKKGAGASEAEKNAAGKSDIEETRIDAALKNGRRQGTGLKAAKEEDTESKTDQNFAPILCCVDEVLRGTNTVERISASSQILKWMAGKQMICLAATHDIELTYILEGIYENYHFEEQVTDEKVTFDYQMREGRAMTRNAIRLLHLMGFEDEIIEEAEKMAENISSDQVYASYCVKG
ncbi:MAG: hypothetical protein LUF30_09345, partial [Lachnospiraceae bacterium]|nr:hypothetical protein [Lachnospiraceae bacterium]